ncbi:hypothetical protein ACQKNC_15985 [Lysinibacillus sp. NPDC094177]|uniref:hypothetical protein n=1 Tax=Lysinibacillus sp. NPDC094177 TaxID=3390580 RepID=UPI003D078B08
MYRFVYMTTNKLNGKKYIGKHTTKDLNDGYYGSNSELIEDIKVYGENNFERIILEYANSEEELRKKESYYLRTNSVVENSDFYNGSYSSTGGNFIQYMTTEQYEKYIEKQRKVQTGKKRSQKTKERISKNNVGFKGKKHTKESAKKISESLKGKNLGRKHKRKIAVNCSKGKVYCYFEGNLKYEFISGADGVRKFLELGLIKSNSTFGKALRNDGQVSKGKLKGWEIIRIDKNTVLSHN